MVSLDDGTATDHPTIDSRFQVGTDLLIAQADAAATINPECPLDERLEVGISRAGEGGAPDVQDISLVCVESAVANSARCIDAHLADHPGSHTVERASVEASPNRSAPPLGALIGG